MTMKIVFDKIIERLQERKTFYENRMSEMGGTDRDVEDWGSVKAYACAIEIVNQLAEEYSSKSSSLENDDWIPCERELPPQPKENPLYEGKAVEIYLVCTEDGDLPFRAFWNGEFFTQGFRRENVIAWQPLPAPYQQK